MPSQPLPTEVADRVARLLADESISLIEAHVDAQRLRYGCPDGISAMQSAEIREQLRFDFTNVLAELTIRPEST